MGVKMTYPTALLLLLVLWTCPIFSLPATKLEPVKPPTSAPLMPATNSSSSSSSSSSNRSSKNSTSRPASTTTLTDRLELNLPLKISKEELVHWITHAMRLMASRINVTLETVAAERMPAERADKLRNCSIALTQLIDKMSGAARNGTASKTDKSKASMPPGSKPSAAHKDLRASKLDCKRANDSAADKLCNKTKNSEALVSPSPPSSAKTVVETQKSFNPISKYVQELTIVNSYNDARSKIFRDPNVFPPYDDKHKITLPLEPVRSNEKMKNYYSSTEGTKNMSDRVGLNSYNAGQDPGGSIQFVPLNGNTGYSLATSQQTGLDLNHLSNVVSSFFGKQQLGTPKPGTSPKPIISVPFEAYITIHQDAKAPDTSTPSARRETTKKGKKTKNQDSHLEASTNNSAETALPDSRAKKKGKNSGKTTLVFEGDESETTIMPEAKKKKNKKTTTPAKKPQQPAALQFIFRMLNYINKNSSSPTQGVQGVIPNLIAAFTKKSPNSKLVQMRGKKNGTKSEKQVDEEDEDAAPAPPERDIFDDDDDEPSGGDDDYDYNDDAGSLGSLEDLLPLIIPILEDISDPESDTDIGEFLAAAIPLLQGLSEPDPETGEAPDFIGVLGPLVQSLFLGRDGMGSDSGAILGPLVQLIGPFIGPLVGPIIGPLSSSLSGEQGSSLGALLSALLAPLSQPVEPGGLSPIAIVTADVISILLKELSKPGSDIDVGAVVSQIITGTLSGASAGLSGGSKGKRPTYGPPPPAYGPPAGGAPPASQIEFFQPPPAPSAPKRSGKSQKKAQRFRSQATQYRPQATHPESPLQTQLGYEQLAAPANYGNYGSYGVPANTVSPFSLLGNAFKDILASSVNLFTAFLSASTASSGASSQESSSGSYGHPAPAYGPPHAGYGYHKP